MRKLLLAITVAWGTISAIPARADPPALSAYDIQSYKAAFKAADANHWDQATADAARAQDMLLAKVIDWLYLVRPSTDAGFETVASFIAANPDWPKLDALRERAEDAMPNDMAPSRVRAWFERYPPVSATGKIRYAEALLAGGEEQKGLVLLRKAWIQGNLGVQQARMFLKKHRHQLRSQDNVARLDRLLWDGQASAARFMMRMVDPGHAALGEARLRLQAMAGGVEYALRRVPGDLKRDPGLLFDRLRWRRRKDKDDGAREILERPPANLVRPELWWQERMIQVHRVLLKGGIAEAFRLAEHHGQRPGSVSYADAEWLSGWIALRRLHKPSLALEHFGKMAAAVRYPISRARAQYWEARAFEALGKSKEARDAYGFAARYVMTYYGQLAALRLHPAARPTLPPPPNPAIYQREAFDGRELVRIVRELGQIGEDELKEAFIRRLADLTRSPEEAELVAELAVEQMRPDLAVRLARLTWHNEVPLTVHGYPLRRLPSAVSAENALILAVIRQESAFDERAVSRAGAMGLMQLLPATARKVARWLGLSYATSKLTTDPNYNVRVGSAYLSQLLDDFGGNYALALAAYNAGPARVHQWIREQGDPRSSQADIVDWIEMIPYNETRNYVQRVLEALQVYRERIPGTRIGLNIETDMGGSVKTVSPADPR